VPSSSPRRRRGVRRLLLLGDWSGGVEAEAGGLVGELFDPLGAAARPYSDESAFGKPSCRRAECTDGPADRNAGAGRRGALPGASCESHIPLSTVAAPFERTAVAGLSEVYTWMCRMVSVVRTNVELDEELVTEAMRRYGLPTRRAAIDFALRRLVGDAMTRDEALAMEGTGWDADLDELRVDRMAALE
jgi:Arc/MetJ family transcription regulator